MTVTMCSLWYSVALLPVIAQLFLASNAAALFPSLQVSALEAKLFWHCYHYICLTISTLKIDDISHAVTYLDNALTNVLLFTTIYKKKSNILYYSVFIIFCQSSATDETKSLTLNIALEQKAGWLKETKDENHHLSQYINSL